jgi:hypothetical protein
MGLSLGLGQTQDYKIGVCCFSAKHAAFRQKSPLIDMILLHDKNTMEVKIWLGIHIL